MFWLLLNYFCAVSRPVFLTGPRSVTTRENFWSSQGLTNASTIVQIYPFIHPATPAARSSARAATHLPPRPPTSPPYKKRWVWLIIKSPSTARLFEMTFTSASALILAPCLPEGGTFVCVRGRESLASGIPASEPVHSCTQMFHN